MTDESRPAELHPADELARLAAGLGAALDRRLRSGHRALPRPGGAALELPASPCGAAPAPPPVAQAAPPAIRPDRSEIAPPRGQTDATVERFAAPTRPTTAAPLAEPAARAEPARAPASRDPARREAPSDAAAREAALTAGLPPHAADLFRKKRDEVRTAARAARDLGELAAGVAACRACRLCATRTRTVFADGSPAARVMFIGEGPGAEEDRTGVPFVGAAGQLLTAIIENGMGLARSSDVYIANVVKCRPPENRDPTPHEKAICGPWLERQIELADPELIIPLGTHAAQQLLRSSASIGKLRGRVHRVDGRRLVPTYHPSWVLHQSEGAQPAAKAEIWKDIRVAMTELGLSGVRAPLEKPR